MLNNDDAQVTKSPHALKLTVKDKKKEAVNNEHSD